MDAHVVGRGGRELGGKEKRGLRAGLRRGGGVRLGDGNDRKKKNRIE
jgi:hypothetical protein